MSVGDIYEAKVYYNIGSEVTMNVVHLKESLICNDDVPAETVANIVYTNWNTFYATALFSDQSSVVLIQTRRIKPTAGIPSTLLIGTAAHPAISGTDLEAPVPSTSAILISLYSSVFTKNGRGRMYIPGMGQTQQNDGQMAAGAIPLAQAIADILEATQVAIAPGTGEFQYAVYSRSLATAQPVFQAVPHTNLATQRGRRNHPGIGL